jgi:hypothetical protein
MFKVFAIAMLVITVIGAAGVAVYDSSKPDQPGAEQPSRYPNRQADPRRSLGTTKTVRATGTCRSRRSVGTWVAGALPVDDFGFELTVDGSGEIIYVELGPTTYWQAKGITLNTEERVTVVGFTQDGLYHAAVVTKMDGSQLTVRDATSGQPLWSGGVIGGQNNGSQTPQTQVSAADWITVEGVVTTVTQNSLTIETTEAASLTLQLGRPGFAAEQGVNFAIGDQVRVIGYDSVGQFRAGEIDNLTQGGRLMLLDPNGRPLWAGPGTAGGQSQSAQGGQGQGGQGQSRGYRGGRTS